MLPERRGPALGPAPTDVIRYDDTARNATRRLIVWGRHSRADCEARSFQSGPCPRCCRCRRDCHHPAFAVLEEVQ